MTSAEYKSFIERVKICLRNKRLRRDDPKCTLNEIFQTFSQEEKRLYHYYKLPSFLNSFYEAIKVKSPTNSEQPQNRFRHKQPCLLLQEQVHFCGGLGPHALRQKNRSCRRPRFVRRFGQGEALRFEERRTVEGNQHQREEDQSSIGFAVFEESCG